MINEILLLALLVFSIEKAKPSDLLKELNNKLAESSREQVQYIVSAKDCVVKELEFKDDRYMYELVNIEIMKPYKSGNFYNIDIVCINDRCIDLNGQIPINSKDIQVIGKSNASDIYNLLIEVQKSCLTGD